MCVLRTRCGGHHVGRTSGPGSSQFRMHCSTVFWTETQAFSRPIDLKCERGVIVEPRPSTMHSIRSKSVSHVRISACIISSRGQSLAVLTLTRVRVFGLAMLFMEALA